MPLSRFCISLIALAVALMNMCVQAEVFSDAFKRRMEYLFELSSSNTIDQIQTIVDVGANEGHWALMISKIFPAAKVYMVEANPGILIQNYSIH